MNNGCRSCEHLDAWLGMASHPEGEPSAHANCMHESCFTVIPDKNPLTGEVTRGIRSDDYEKKNKNLDCEYFELHETRRQRRKRAKREARA